MPTLMPELMGLQQHHYNQNSSAAATHESSALELSTTSQMNAASASPADIEAREWWLQREAKVERELYSGLLKRMDTQRKQVIAFKAEQSKWENRLQVKIKKDAHDRKLLGEYNIELQAALAAFDDKLAAQQRDADAQTSHIIALESLLRDKAVESAELQLLRQRNNELTERVAQWERFHRADAAAAKQLRALEQEELLNHLETNLLVATTLSPTPATLEAASLSHTNSSKSDNAMLPSRRRSAPVGSSSSSSSSMRHSDSTGSFTGASDDDALLLRIADLEKMCKQKDQTIHSLKSLCERQEVVLDEKLKLASAKYDQVKAINVALQTRLLASLTES